MRLKNRLIPRAPLDKLSAYVQEHFKGRIDAKPNARVVDLVVEILDDLRERNSELTMKNCALSAAMENKSRPESIEKTDPDVVAPEKVIGTFNDLGGIDAFEKEKGEK